MKIILLNYTIRYSNVYGFLLINLSVLCRKETATCLVRTRNVVLVTVVEHPGGFPGLPVHQLIDIAPEK